MTTAFVFGGGGRWGAVEAGMASALAEGGVQPDLIVGSSIGAFNGAMVAFDPSPAGVARLRQAWAKVQESGVLSAKPLERARTVVRQKVATHSTAEMRRIVERFLPVDDFAGLRVEFQCVAASVEQAAERWFSTGPLVDAILASAAVPVLFPPVVIDGESFYDGGLVNSVPVDRAVELGASRIYVLQVGRIEQPLRPPSKRHEPALLAFEIARRHRFARALETMPPHVELHILPSGNPLAFDDSRQLRWRDTAGTEELIDSAWAATRAYLHGSSD